MRRAPARAAVLLVAVVALGLLVTQLSARFADADLPPLDRSTLELLAGVSPLDRLEWTLLALLAGARLLRALLPRRRLLEPLFDLPLLALLTATAGGSLAPLDPALPLTYLAALALLRGTESGTATPRRLAVELLLGGLAGHLLVQRHERALLDADLARVASAADEAAAELQRDGSSALATVAESLAALDPREELAPLHAALVERDVALQRFLATLAGDAGRAAPALAAARLALQVAEERATDRWFAARETLRATLEGNGGAEGGGGGRVAAIESLDLLRESGANLRQELLARADALAHALERRDRRAADHAEFLADSRWRRVALLVALLACAAVIVLLRQRMEAAVRDAEERRAQREIELAAAEKEHWIAVTAGLTHGLGNDIVAYDAWLAEAGRALAATPPLLMRAQERIGAVAASNRGRLAFLQFLDALARQRQIAAGDAPPLPFEPIALPELLVQARRKVAEVESADLPSAGSDPAVDRRRRLLTELPLEIELATPRAATLRRGQRGAVDFFAYELLKNALRSATGRTPLHARLDWRDGVLTLALENDVEVDESPRGDGAAERCVRCGAAGPLLRVRRRRDAPPACARCFPAAFAALLEQSFAPGKGAGTGLGLFLIRYFLATFWNGTLTAQVVAAAPPRVAFTLALPDPDPPDGPPVPPPLRR